VRLFLAFLLMSCATPRQFRVFPADKTYSDQCPGIDIDRSEYVELEVLESQHHEPTLLVGIGDDSRLPDVTFKLCHPAPDPVRSALLCLPGKVYRRLASPLAIAEPFCKDDKCDLAFAMWVVGPDQSMKRATNCRLAAGMMQFEDPGDPNSSIRIRCHVKDKLDAAVQPRDCYPPY